VTLTKCERDMLETLRRVRAHRWRMRNDEAMENYWALNSVDELVGTVWFSSGTVDRCLNYYRHKQYAELDFYLTE
jgi:hypothetical protein